MGLFDEIRCKYLLFVQGANELLYQTKDTLEQSLDQYEIREDGTLWHERYDTEDRSDPNATPGSLGSLAGCMTRVNPQWEFVEGFTGEIRFYTNKEQKPPYRGWIEWSAYFKAGKLREINLIENKPIE